jgi:serine protease AprX
MLNRTITLLSLCFLLTRFEKTVCQVAPGKYWIFFKDKNNSPYSLARPKEFLSERSILRRARQHIDYNGLDIPVNSFYIDSLQRLGLKIINVSKWLNGAIVSSGDLSILNIASKYSFVKEVQLYPEINKKFSIDRIKIEKDDLLGLPIKYGFSDNQIKMLRGEYLHQNGYQGGNIMVAILDAGFTNADQVSSLQHLWNNGRIIAYRDFVKDGIGFFKTNEHGTLVTSIIGGIEDGYIFGSAPEAQFVLLRTEYGPTEYIIEEYNWVCGAEFADSIGADVINSSLGYTEFDDQRQDHTYNDMDGKTCVSSIGATIASSKGIVVVVSAGNDGAKPWFKIGSPADADNILTVGAVDSLGFITGFSSRGPTYDGRVKPDVCAQGLATVGQHPSGSILSGSGTSFSAPLIAGLSACLWQSNPEATNLQLIEAVRQSSSLYSDPNNEYGYGIPDFALADRILKTKLLSEKQPLVSFNVYPNPAKDHLYLEVYQNQPSIDKLVSITCFDISGRIVFNEKAELSGKGSFLQLRNFDHLSSGYYLLMIELSGQVYSYYFVKIES